MNPTTNLLEVLLSVYGFYIDGATGRIAFKLADTSLSLSSLGLQVSTTYKSDLQQIKTDTETFKT